MLLDISGSQVFRQRHRQLESQYPPYSLRNNFEQRLGRKNSSFCVWATEGWSSPFFERFDARCAYQAVPASNKDSIVLFNIKSHLVRTRKLLIRCFQTEMEHAQV